LSIIKTFLFLKQEGKMKTDILTQSFFNFSILFRTAFSGFNKYPESVISP